jgi:hypothetical protein
VCSFSDVDVRCVVSQSSLRIWKSLIFWIFRWIRISGRGAKETEITDLASCYRP